MFDALDLVKLLRTMERKHNLKLAWTRGNRGIHWDDEDAVLYNIGFKRELNNLLKAKATITRKKKK